MNRLACRKVSDSEYVILEIYVHGPGWAEQHDPVVDLCTRPVYNRPLRARRGGL